MSYLGSQDTLYVGTLKGAGRVYQQTFIDTYRALGLARLYTSKHPNNSADILTERAPNAAVNLTPMSISCSWH